MYITTRHARTPPPQKSHFLNIPHTLFPPEKMRNHISVAICRQNDKKQNVNKNHHQLIFHRLLLSGHVWSILGKNGYKVSLIISRHRLFISERNMMFFFHFEIVLISGNHQKATFLYFEINSNLRPQITISK